MGLLVNGVWLKESPTQQQEESVLHISGQFRHWVTADGGPGPSGDGGFAARAGRYHLYVSTACPCSHRVLILRRLKGLSPLIGLSVVNPKPNEAGWHFLPGRGVINDDVMGAEYLHQIYTAAQTDYSGRVTVPVLWDTQRKTIVSNESADIMQMFNQAFNGLVATTVDYYPTQYAEEIDALNEMIAQGLNQAVYRAGLALSQEAYELAVLEVFETLAQLESRLTERRYLCGAQPTMADWRLFVSLVRFDAIYAGLFKCNIRPLSSYPQLNNYLRDLYQYPGVSETVDLQASKLYYYRTHLELNPYGLVPLGPAWDFTATHDRCRFIAEA